MIEEDTNAIDENAWIIRPATEEDDDDDKKKKLEAILDNFCNQPDNVVPNITFVGFREGKDSGQQELSFACDYINKNYNKPQNLFGTLEVRDPVNVSSV